MRAILVVLLILVTQPSLAAECLLVVDSPSRPQIVLRGVIEYKPSSRNPGAVTVLLKLSTPICVRGVARDGLPFKKENVESIVLGLPANLMGTLHPLDRVMLRGELWGPAVNEEALDNVTFAVREAL